MQLDCILVTKLFKKEKHIKYLGIYIDSHLNWKYQVLHISHFKKN